MMCGYEEAVWQYGTYGTGAPMEDILETDLLDIRDQCTVYSDGWRDTHCGLEARSNHARYMVDSAQGPQRRQRVTSKAASVIEDGKGGKRRDKRCRGPRRERGHG